MADSFGKPITDRLPRRSGGWIKPLLLWCLILGIPVGVLTLVVLLGRTPPTEWVDARTGVQRVGDAEVAGKKDEPLPHEGTALAADRSFRIRAS